MDIDESGSGDQIFGGNDLIEVSGDITGSDRLDLVVPKD